MRVTGVDAITADFLAALLGTEVSGLRAERIGTGQVGATYRINFTGADGARTLIGKFAAPDAFTRQTAVAQGSYRRETGFYRDLAQSALPVPRAYHVAFDEETHDFALLLEDLPNHRPGDQLRPVTVPEAEAAVDALVCLHRATWDAPKLAALSYLPGSRDFIPAPLDPLYMMLWPAFVQRYGDRVSASMRRVGDAYVGRCEAWAARRPGLQCLVHGDYRQDNLLFGPGGEVIVVDWQTTAVGAGATDLAYFAGTALSVDDRRGHEGALFDRWLAGVPRAVTKREDQWLLYRRDAFAGFLMGVAAAMIVGQTERGDAMFLAMCERAAAMVEDHAAASLF